MRYRRQLRVSLSFDRQIILQSAYSKLIYNISSRQQLQELLYNTYFLFSMDNPPREISQAEKKINPLDQTHENMLNLRTEDIFNDSSVRKPEDSGRMPLENIEVNQRPKFFKKIFIVVGGLATIALITIAVVLITQQTSKNKSQETKPLFDCSKSNDCIGVRADVRDMIISKYSDPLQAKGLLQVARKMNLPEDIKNKTQQSINDIYKNIFRSLECAKSLLGDSYSAALDEIQKMQYQTQNQLLNYLYMIEHTQNYVIKLEPSNSISCEFDIPESRRLQSTETNNCQAQNISWVLYFFNGVGHTPQVARSNLQYLFRFTLAYPQTQFGETMWAGKGTRQSNGILHDAWLAYNQKTAQSGTGLSSLEALKFIIGLIGTYQLSAITFSNAEEDLIRYVTQYTTAEQEANMVVVGEKARIAQKINQGKKVVLVAHSQGSLYANKLYNSFSTAQKKHIKLVYVGAAASIMADGTSNYVTNPKDRIINFVRLVASNSSFNQPLVGNVPQKSFSLINHEFTLYLDNYPQIMQLIKKVKQQAEQPVATIGSGPITVQLTWDNQPDVDLHIFQPDNTHVYYSAKRGSVGYLDLDDTNAKGPEHYYSSCEKMKLGQYIVSLNFYLGSSQSAISIATVEVTAGNEYKTATLTLKNPQGANGNENPPYKVFSILVSQSSDGLQYTITKL